MNRILAGLAETKHDENGLIWPLAIAPYEVILSALDVTDANTLAASEALYADLKAAKVDVLLDDRDQRPGVKFKDADLIGIPLRVNVGGKGLKEGVVELKWRNEKDATKVPVADAARVIQEHLAARRIEEAASVPA